MTEQKKMNNEIVVLPSWYPSKLDQFSGNFIQRHVKAISLFRSLYIIYVIKDEAGKITSDISAEITVLDNYTEKIIYYHVKKTGIGVLDKLFSQIKSSCIYHRELKEYVKLKGCPSLIHVHVVFKAGLAALWAKKRWKIPFVISEHWSVFLNEANYRIENLSLVQQMAIKRILKQADAITVVSDWLGKAIGNNFKPVNYSVIPNVVDHSIFFPGDKIGNEVIHFIHPSSMLYEKNTECILEAFSILKKNKFDVVLNIFGYAPGTLIQLADALELNDVVFFRGEVPQLMLAMEMQQSDALILYSRFETFGCVLIEANAAGIPVIVSDIPVFHELVEENINGLFVQQDKCELLAEKLIEFISGKYKFNKMEMVNGTEKYSFESVGKQFDDLYRQVIV